MYGIKQTQPPRAYAYVRASTEAQVLSPTIQRDKALAYYEYKLKHRGFIWGGVYEDAATTSGIPMAERSAGVRLLADLQAGDAVIMTSLDRGFRSATEASLVCDKWHAQGVGIHFLNMDIDTTTPVGGLLFRIVAAVAQFEREVNRERTKDALRQVKKEGRFLGRPPWGWMVKGEGKVRKLVKDKHTLECARKFRDLHVRGHAAHEIVMWAAANALRRTDGKPWNIHAIRKAIIGIRQLERSEAKAHAEGRTPTPFDFRVGSRDRRRKGLVMRENAKFDGRE